MIAFLHKCLHQTKIKLHMCQTYYDVTSSVKNDQIICITSASAMLHHHHDVSFQRFHNDLINNTRTINNKSPVLFLPRAGDCDPPHVLRAGWIMHGKIQRNTPATGNRLRIKFLESNSDRTNSHPAQGRGGFNRLSLSIMIAAPALVPSSLSSEVYHSLHLIARLLLSLSALRCEECETI